MLCEVQSRMQVAVAPVSISLRRHIQDSLSNSLSSFILRLIAIFAKQSTMIIVHRMFKWYGGSKIVVGSTVITW